MKNFFRFFLISAAIVLLAAGCGNSQNAAQENGSVKEPATQNQSQSGLAPATQNLPPVNPSNTTSPGSTEKVANIRVTQIVRGTDLAEPAYNIPQGENAIALLKRAHKVDTKTYSGIGEFVESIDGMKPDSKHFWAFYVNGKSSSVGAGSYVLKNNDKVEWKLEEIK